MSLNSVITTNSTPAPVFDVTKFARRLYTLEESQKLVAYIARSSDSVSAAEWIFIKEQAKKLTVDATKDLIST